MFVVDLLKRVLRWLCVCADLLKRVLRCLCLCRSSEEVWRCFVQIEESVEMFVCLCRSSEERVEMCVFVQIF